MNSTAHPTPKFTFKRRRVGRVLTGAPFFEAVFSALDCDVVWNVHGGEFIQPVREVATVTGKVGLFCRTFLFFSNVEILLLNYERRIAVSERLMSKMQCRISSQQESYCYNPWIWEYTYRDVSPPVIDVTNMSP